MLLSKAYWSIGFSFCHMVDGHAWRGQQTCPRPPRRWKRERESRDESPDAKAPPSNQCGGPGGDVAGEAWKAATRAAWPTVTTTGQTTELSDAEAVPGGTPIGSIADGEGARARHRRSRALYTNIRWQMAASAGGETVGCVCLVAFSSLWIMPRRR